MAKKMEMKHDKKMKAPKIEPSDVASQGYRKSAFGGSEPENYLIKDAWNRQPQGDEMEKTSIHEIAEQLNQSDFYSGGGAHKKGMHQGNENG